MEFLREGFRFFRGLYHPFTWQELKNILTADKVDLMISDFKWLFDGRSDLKDLMESATAVEARTGKEIAVVKGMDNSARTTLKLVVCDRVKGRIGDRLVVDLDYHPILINQTAYENIKPNGEYKDLAFRTLEQNLGLEEGSLNNADPLTTWNVLHDMAKGKHARRIIEERDNGERGEGPRNIRL